MSIVLENLRRDTRMRMESDYEMSPAWILVPIIPIVGLIVFFTVFFGTLFTLSTAPPPPGTPPDPGLFALFFVGIFAFLPIVGFVSAILYAYIIYKLVNRRNKHFQRQLFLYDDLTNVAKELATKKGVEISLNLNNMQRTNQEARFEETEKSAVLFAILSFIPVVNLVVYYVYYFLMNDFHKHERREDMFLDDLNRALMAAGVTINLPRRTLPIPDRSFVLYFILSIITLGIFSIYWLYVLLTDPNSHFRQQALTEDTILAQVTPLMV